MKNKYRKSIKDITNKQIDNFSKSLSEKAKRIKEENGTNPTPFYKAGVCMPRIINFINKMQEHYGKNLDYIDWEEIACEIMIKYYEQQESAGIKKTKNGEQKCIK